VQSAPAIVMRRVQSAPVIMNVDPVYGRGDDDDDDDDVAMHRRANSNGAGPASPTAKAVMWRFWYHILGRDIQLEPRLVVQDMNNRIFVGIYLFPSATFMDNTPFPAVRRAEWHASVTTAYFAYSIRDMMWRDIGMQTAFIAWRRLNTRVRLEATLQAMWLSVFPTRYAVVALDKYTRGSWGFKVPPCSQLGSALSLLQLGSEHVVMFDFPTRLRLRTRRELHVSWN